MPLTTQAVMATSKPEELLRPLTRPETQSTSLPAWAASYMSLLADSSSSPGSMQRHMVKLLAHGISGASKTAQFITDPLDPVKGVLANKGSHLIMQGACKVAHTVAASLDSMDEQDTLPQLPGFAGPLRHAPAKRTKSADDLCCERAHPLEGKLLSLVLSMMMTAGTSGAMSSLQALVPDLPFALPQSVAELALPAAAATPAAAREAAAASALLTAPSLQSAASLQSASSLLPRASSLVHWAGGDSGLEGVLGAGGMATSTAMKLLRADSKLLALPDLGNVLDSVLDAVKESMDEGEVVAATHRREVPEREGNREAAVKLVGGAAVEARQQTAPEPTSVGS